ncbi:MAG: amino acid adenylation domain-containing protein [Candidatus Latescibacteria bacterium]|nr:amino acid adenylation domain-containing protein [Candidatus Latescibacterota bacterium]
MTSLLQHLVTAQAERWPDALAVVMNQERLTYRQLDEDSNRLARLLKDAGCRRGDRVCLLLPKSPAAIVGILGILKADCLYVPIDPSSPAARVAKIVESCENRWILAAGAVAPLLDDLLAEDRFRAALSIGWMGPERAAGRHFTAAFSSEDVRAYPPMPLDARNVPTDGAHILFTSGSTGTPKGVVITHANVLHFVRWAVGYFGTSPSDRISGHPPLHFDLSTFDIFGTFMAGAQLHLVPPDLNLLPNKLADFIRDSELTQWFSVPSILNYMTKFDAVRPNDFPALKRLLWCGEVFPTPALRYWMQRLPHVAFTNLYGPTETTIASSYYTVPRCPDEEQAAIPIGTPCEGEELLILDDALRPVPPDEVGNLYIRGVGLSPGYWRDPEKTRAVFLPNPADPADRVYKTGDLARIGSDGLVYFLGRADSQIKSRGYRIELGEIESALNALNMLQECAVVAIQTDGFEGAAMCCGYVPEPDAGVTPMTLRKALSTMLPAYMLPSRWMAFERLPKNANGKIDRRALREWFAVPVDTEGRAQRPV